MILNLGCGSKHITGAVNVDVCSTLEPLPDKVFDLKERFPFDDESVDEIYFFHTIEHIEKQYHYRIFKEIRRVLKKDGMLFVSYPEFRRCVDGWINCNDVYKKAFWEATIFGLQRQPNDFHVCIMDSIEFVSVLQIVGFRDVTCTKEPAQPFNTVVKCFKGTPFKTYEEVLKEGVFGVAA